MGKTGDILLSLQQAARFLGVSRSSLLRLEAEGRLAPFRTPGGHRRYDQAALDLLRTERTQRYGNPVAMDTHTYDQVSRRNTLLTVLNQVATALVAEHDMAAALTCVLDACRHVTGADYGTLEYRPRQGEPLQLLTGRTLPQAASPRSTLSVPLSAENDAFSGGIFLAHSQPGRFDETHLEMVRALAAQATVALEKMLAADENAETRRELESIFHGIADPLTVLDDHLIIVECNDGLLRRLGKSRDEVVGRHYFEALIGHVEEGMWNVAPLVFETGHPQTARVPMVTGDGAALLMDVTAYPVRDSRGNVVKVVEYAKEVTAEVRLQLALMDRNEELKAATESLARQARELDQVNRQLQEKCEELERIAITDVMTGLPNHRAFQQGLMTELKRVQRNHFPLSLLLLDVDHFKTYNDAYGHPAGDEVLRDVGGVLMTALRETDIPARYGGEEFAVVLSGTSKKEALVVAERIRTAIEAHVFPKRPVTVSIGLAAFPEDAKDKDALIWLADQALYAAKQAGRNTTRAWPVSLILEQAA